MTASLHIDYIERHLKEVLRGCPAFSGHGVQFEGQADASFCPQDAHPFKNETTTLVSLGAIYRELDSSMAAMKVLLVDASRDDPDANRQGRVSAARSLWAPQGVAALFSCAVGESSFESENVGRGVFFYHVLQGLQGKAKKEHGKVTFAGLAAYVSEQVREGQKSVPKLIGGGARQSPHLQADYSAEPVLLSPGDFRRKTVP